MPAAGIVQVQRTDVVLQIAASREHQESAKKLRVKMFPGALGFPSIDRQYAKHHGMLGYQQRVVVAGELPDVVHHQAPRDSEVGIKAKPPQNQNDQIEIAKAQLAGNTLGMRTDAECGEQRNSQ